MTTISPQRSRPKVKGGGSGKKSKSKKGGGGSGSTLNLGLVAVAGCILFVLLILYVAVPDDEAAVVPDPMVGGDRVKQPQQIQEAGQQQHHHDSKPHLFKYDEVRKGLRSEFSKERKQLERALKKLRKFGGGDGNLPARLRTLRDRHAIIGERLSEVRDGTETVMEILHGGQRRIRNEQNHNQGGGAGGAGGDASVADGGGGGGGSINYQPPMELSEVIDYLDGWIHTLHETLSHHKHSTFEQIWEAYHDLTVKTLYPWDQEYLRRMPDRRDDGSIFLSLATYRDENCFNTIYQAYKKAKNPEKLFVGLVQQNCHSNCKSGVLANLSMVHVPPDEDCEKLFCDTDLGKPICENKQIRTLNIDEPESLGPYAARFFASKLWYGENWFMQTGRVERKTTTLFGDTEKLSNFMFLTYGFLFISCCIQMPI